MQISTLLAKGPRSLAPYTLLCACLLQACTDSDPEPLRAGLLEFEESHNRYSDAAYKASRAYKGNVELATLDTNNAGVFASNILMGPLSAANTPNSVPLNTDHYGVEGALFPGWPVAILSRTGFDHSPLQSRSLGTAGWEQNLELQQQSKFQLPWWNLFSPAIGGQSSCSGGGTVTWSYNLLVDAAEGEDERSVTWDHCRYKTTAGPLFFGDNTKITTDGVWLNGTAIIHKQSMDKYTIAWDAVEYQADGRSWRISGMETSSGPFGCGFDQQRVSNLLIESIDSGDSVLLENFRSAIVGEPPESRVCPASGLFNNWFEGRMLHSRYGAVDISTPVHLKYLSPSSTIDKLVEWPATDPNDPAKILGGKLIMHGLKGSEIRIEPEIFRRFGEIQSREYYLPEKDGLAITVSNTDGASNSFHFEWGMAKGVRQGAIADLDDSDSDGLPNAWERVFNFDPANASDADEDTDADRLSNLEEFQQMTNPYVQDHPTVDTDTAMSLSYWKDLSANDDRRLINARVTAPTIGNGYRRKNWPIVLTLQGDARFVSTVPFHPYSHESTCRWGDNDQTLICEFDELRDCDWNGCRYLGIDGYLVVELFSEAPVIMEAAIEHGSADPNPSNDTTAVTLQW